MRVRIYIFIKEVMSLSSAVGSLAAGLWLCFHGPHWALEEGRAFFLARMHSRRSEHAQRNCSRSGQYAMGAELQQRGF